ncbi:MAG: nucleotidyl transferase AbiEii/AbiGii toxin family protein [Patescibacteria group bacterium]
MDTSIKKQLNLYWDALPRPTKKALDFLSTQEWLSRFGWYLAGGTALALQTGHRTSVDLDFFTTEPKFLAQAVTGNFSGNKEWHSDSVEDNTIYGKLFDAKISFIAYPFFVPKQAFLRHGTVNILKPLDIAVMKIVAISQRGKKRDFFDLYWCVHNLEPLEQTITRLREQCPSVAHDYHHILRSMVYFEDAEIDPTPETHFKASWKEVKDFFTDNIPRITKKLIDLK